MKKVFCFLFCSLVPVSVLAEGVKKSDMVLHIRRIGLELSKTDVRNAPAYANSPIQALNASSQEFVKGVADLALEYKKNKFNWTNSLFAEYGKTTLQPYNAPVTSNENADKVLLSSDVSYACWEFQEFKFGPTSRVQYETEFTNNGDAPRQNLVRSNAGISVFDHGILKSLYITGVYEYDFTYTYDPISKLAAEVGWRLEYAVRDGVKFVTNGYYRDYLAYSGYIGTDLKRDLSLVLRLDTNLWGNFTMGPYAQYRLAKSREADVYGSNIILGVSFNYITKYKLL